MKRVEWLFLLLMVFFSCDEGDEGKLKPGMTIRSSMKVTNQVYFLPSKEGNDRPIIIIEGDDIEVDFNDATLIGKEGDALPNALQGVAIQIKKGRNITLKNLTIEGYQYGIIAEEVEGLRLENITASYLYRPNLKDKNTTKNGAGFYLKNCHQAVLESITTIESYRGLVMENCDSNTVYNSEFRFNSREGVALKESSFNVLMHNKIDWNVGTTDASNIRLVGSTSNTLAYNSATHSRYGAQVLSEENATLSDANLLYGNDFSFVTESGLYLKKGTSRLYNNIFRACEQAITGILQSKTEIISNIIQEGGTAIHLTNSQNTTIRQNEIISNRLGVKLIGEKTMSVRHTIDHNLIQKNDTVFDLGASDDVRVVMNQIGDYKTLFYQKNKIGKLYDKKNELNPPSYQMAAMNEQDAFMPAPFPDGQHAMLAAADLSGKQYILVNEWGPYSFKYPVMWLRENKGKDYIFALFGPLGNWKLTNAVGIDRISLKTGTFPATVVVIQSEGAEEMNIELEFIGEKMVTQQGQRIEKGGGYVFGYQK